MIEGIYTRRVENTPANDSTLGVASRQQQEQRGDRQPGASSWSFGDTLTLSTEAQQQLNTAQQRGRETRPQDQGQATQLPQAARGGVEKPPSPTAAVNAQTASAPLTPLASGADGNRNAGFLHSAMETLVRSDKVAALYQAQRDKFITPKALAPNGTGIAYTV